MYARVMIGLLVALWSVIAYKAIHRRPPVAPTLLITPAELPSEPFDPSSILNRRVGDFSVRQVELKEVMDTLRSRTKTSISVDWNDLATLGISPGSRVSLFLFDASLQTGIHATLQSLDPRLDFGISDGGTLLITARPLRLPRSLIVYDVRDLAPQRSPAVARSLIGRGGGGGGTVFGFDDRVESEEQAALVETISAAMHPAGESNLRFGPIALPFAGRWIVMESPDRHRQLQEILRQLRAIKTRTVQKEPGP